MISCPIVGNESYDQQGQAVRQEVKGRRFPSINPVAPLQISIQSMGAESAQKNARKTQNARILYEPVHSAVEKFASKKDNRILWGELFSSPMAQ